MNLQNLVSYCNLNELPSPFEYVSVPSPLNRDTVISAIMIRCGLLTPVYNDPDTFRYATKYWFDSKQWTFEHLIKVIQAEYSPIENVDRYDQQTTTKGTQETKTGSLTDAGSESNIEALSGSDSLTHDESVVNSGSDSFTHDETITNSGSDSLAHDEKVTNSGSDTLAHDETKDYSGTDITTNTVSAFNADTFQNDSKIELAHGESIDTDSTDTTTYGKVSDTDSTDTTTYGKVSDTDSTDTTTYGKHSDTDSTDTTTYGKRIDITKSNSLTRSNNESIAYSGSDVFTQHLHGNIGVTTNQQLINQELELLARFDVYKYIAEQFENDNMIMLY